MSFSSQIKDELSRQISPARHCQIAEIAAILGFCGHIHMDEENCFSIRIHTENVSVARKYFTLLKKAFNCVLLIVSEVQLIIIMVESMGGFKQTWC